MMYVDFSAGNKDYKLRLNTRNTIALEKQLGGNPLTIFGNGDKIPTIETMVTILHAALQPYHHGISMNDAFDIFDAYLEEHNAIEFIMVILDIYRASGLIQKEEENEKN